MTEYKSCIVAYSQPHRYYHNAKHVQQMIEQLDRYDDMISISEGLLLETAIRYHDVVYDPRRTDNEALSCEVMRKTQSWRFSEDDLLIIERLIMATVPGSYTRKEGDDKLVNIIRRLDCASFYDDDIATLINNFHLIMKEYQFVDYHEFIKAHLEFFNKFGTVTGINYLMGANYIRYVSDYVPNIGLYVGSFNPFHIGHMSVLEQAEKVFDKVIVASPRGSLHDKTPALDYLLPYHEVIYFDGLLTDFVASLQKKFSKLTIVRGLRNGEDLSFEVNLKQSYKDLGMESVPVMYLTTDYPHVSSTMVRSIADISEKYKMYIPTKFEYAHREWWNDPCPME